MLYCSNCGKKIDKGNMFCTGCGIKLNNSLVKEEVSGLKEASIILGILGIVGSLTWIFSPISFILALIGLILGIASRKRVKNTIGIVLNSLGIGLSLIMIFLLVMLFRLVVNIANGYHDETYYNDYSEYYEKFKNVVEKY